MRLKKIVGSMAAVLILVGVLLMPTPAAKAAPCTCTIWSSSVTPANVSVNNTTAVEVGTKFKVDTSGYITGVRFYKASNNTGTHTGNLWKADGTLLARATFSSETSSGWQTVTFAQAVPVVPGATYVASYFAPVGNYSYNPNYFASQGVDNGPLHALANGVAGNGNGVYRYSSGTVFPNSSYQSTNYWVDVVFETKPPVRTSSIVVLTNTTNKFSNYYGEILRNEGYSFDTADLGDATASFLAPYDVVILGETALTSGQVTTLTNWVNGGGNLIAMRPDAQLAGLAGLTDTPNTLSNQYLKMITTSGSPATGLPTDTMQFHGTADRYSLNGATKVAELFSSASAATGDPAVSIRQVGTGQIAVFTYDLARSVVLTRQGNPAWAGQNRETNDATIRANDMFFGNAAGNSQPDWVDLNKVAIPQADEQQRLLGNLITHMNADKKPIPHFWYLPKGKKAAVVMTADDHATGDAGAQVTTRLQRYISQSPSGCNVALWECVRSSAYYFLPSPMSQTQAQNYTNQGFDLGIHLLVNGSTLVNGYPSNTTTCGSVTATTAQTYLSQQMAAFVAKYPTLPPIVSNRTHCIVWSDWDSVAKAEASLGVRMDTNYYYWPGNWIHDRPGMMNGGGFPMRFAGTDGSIIDSYQAMTNLQDEGPEPLTISTNINTLLDNALGSKGYYGVFTANMHTDLADSVAKADTIVAAAQARGVPVVSARQMLNWVDGRNDSKFTGLTWNGAELTFGVTVGNGAQNMLQTMLPVISLNGPLEAISRNGTPVAYTTEVVKGIEYARFTVSNGTYTASYGQDVTAPTITGVTPINGATGVAANTTVRAAFSEPLNPATVSGASFELRDAGNNLVSATVSYDSNTMSAVLTPSQSLALGTTYTAKVTSGTIADQSGNTLAATKTWSFTTVTASPPLTLWASSVVPSSTASTDVNAVEVGVRFTSDVSGYIRGIRFYKGAGNTGTHIGNLWTNGGTKLATATFSGESASGWQQVLFSSPVAITANTTYVASYFAPNGHYAFTQNYFMVNSQNNGTLHAPVSSGTRPNGIYVYSASSAFPTATYMATNYWVDVVFSTTP